MKKEAFLQRRIVGPSVDRFRRFTITNAAVSISLEMSVASQIITLVSKLSFRSVY